MCLEEFVLAQTCHFTGDIVGFPLTLVYEVFILNTFSKNKFI